MALRVLAIQYDAHTCRRLSSLRQNFASERRRRSRIAISAAGQTARGTWSLDI
jgi:hypothetical protein